MKVTAMAFTRSEAENRITGVSLVLGKHILKLFLYPTSQYVKGWEKEVRAWYTACKDVGNHLKKGGKVKPLDYFEWLYETPFHNGINEYYEQVVEQNDKLVPKFGTHEVPDLETLVKALYVKMANSMAKDKEWSQFISDLQEYVGTDN
jgi:hypothetical protein